MNLSYLVPTNAYEFFREAVPGLRDRGLRVAVNAIPPEADLVLAAMLPATPEWLGPLQASGKPFVLWHWDYYSFVDHTEPRWAGFLRLLPHAADVWSCGYETARQLKEVFDLDSYVVPAWVEGAGLAHAAGPTRDVVFYAASSDSFGKRSEWARHACRLAGLPLELGTHQRIPRATYFRRLATCRVYLMTAFEESNATIPAQEAAACGRPVVASDLPSCREVFGDTAYYFPPWDFRALVGQLKNAWAGGPLPGCRERVLAGRDLPVVLDRIVGRLRSVRAGLQTGAW